MTSVLIKSTNMSGSKAQKLTMASLFADMVFFCLWKVTDLWRYVFYPILSWADDMVMSGLDLMTGYVSSIIGWVVNGAAGGNEDVALKSIVRFSSRVAVVLIPQRSELRTLSNPIWMTEEEIQKCRKEAEEEFYEMLSIDEEGLHLHSAMNMLHRPCAGGKMNGQLRVLVVDESIVSRKMTMFSLARGHAFSRKDETLLFRQAKSCDAIKDIFSKSVDPFNVVFIGEGLMTDGDGEVVRLCRECYENCVLIGLLYLDASGEENRKLESLFMEYGGDFVWRQPLPDPTTMWAQINHYLPVEF